MNKTHSIEQLRVGTGWIYIGIFFEPFVRLVFKGYVLTVRVKVLKSGLAKELLIAAKSLSHLLGPLKIQNGSLFASLRLHLAKEIDSTMADYKIEQLSS